MRNVMALCAVFLTFISFASASESTLRSELARCSLALWGEPCAVLQLSDHGRFLKPHTFGDDLFDINNMRTRPWFKVAVASYWVAVAYDSYQDTDDFSPRLNLNESTRVRIDLETKGARRAILVPKSQPFILFPLGSLTRGTHHMGVLYVAHKGVVFSVALRLPGDHRRRSGIAR